MQSMKIGLNATTLLGRASVADMAAHAATAEAEGFSGWWLAELPTGAFDALTALAVIGQSIEHMEIGTAVVPTFPRHPVMLAGQALTVQGAIRPKLSLGIGMSHQAMMAELGLADDKPIRHLREYLDVLMPLVTEGRVDASGEVITGRAAAIYPVTRAPEVVVAALGPQALRVAGRLAAGTNLAWVGPKTIREHIVPTISDAAEQADRPAPRIIATLPVGVTDDPDTARSTLTANTQMYMQLPSYQAMFEREGVASTGELGLIGSVDEVREQVAHLADCGVTDFAASEFGLTADDRARTRELLKQIAAENNGGTS
jgi:F420-dependent oxidoreductase-like protein